MAAASPLATGSEAAAIADEVPGGLRTAGEEQQELLRALRDLPTKMEEALGVRADAAAAARSFAPSRRYWAIVGNGVPNADIAHDYGFFTGNHPYDLAPQIARLREVLDGTCR